MLLPLPSEYRNSDRSFKRNMPGGNEPVHRKRCDRKNIFFLDDVYTAVYTIYEVIVHDDSKNFENGRSRAVRLPKEYRFEDNEVSINRIGNVVMPMPKNEPRAGMLSGLRMFSDDYAESVRSDRQTYFIDHICRTDARR